MRAWILGLLAALLGFYYFIFDTLFGLELTIKLLQQVLPGELQIEKVEGCLLSPIHLSNLHYHEEKLDLRLKQGDLNWALDELFQQKFHIHYANIQALSIQKSQEPESSASLPPLFWLKHLEIDQLTADDIHFTEDKTALRIPHLNLQQIQNQTILSLQLESGELLAKMSIPLDANDAWKIQALLHSRESQITLNGSLSKNWDVHWQIYLNHLENWFPTAKGAIQSTGKISGKKQSPHIEASLSAHALAYEDNHLPDLESQLDFNWNQKVASHVNIRTGSVKLDNFTLPKMNIDILGQAFQQQKKIESHFDFSLNQIPYIHIDFSIPQKSDWSHWQALIFEAKMQVQFADFKNLAAYIPNIKGLEGKLLGNLTWQGSLDQPTLTGKLNISDVGFSIPSLGINIRQAKLSVFGNEKAEIHYTGSLQSKGNFSLEGKTALMENGFPTEISIKGSKLEVLNLSEYQILASPDLKLTYQDKHLNLSGNILIPEAKIEPKDFSDTSSLSSDVVIAGLPPKKPSPWVSIIPSFQVQFVLGDKVFVHYEDLKAWLTGHVKISKVPDGLATASGEFYTLKGSYKAYGKTLNIQTGRLIYTGGSLTNPGLNIRAQREIPIAQMASLTSFTGTTTGNGQMPLMSYQGTDSKQIVGVSVLGTLDTPLVSLYSSPSLSEADAISYLVFGVPKTQVSNTNILAALSSMYASGEKTNSLDDTKDKFQDFFGLSELDIESIQTFVPSTTANGLGTVSNTPSLVLGKKLAPNLFFHTSIGSFSQEPTINITYQLSKHWSLQSEQSSIDTGADIFYSIDRE